MTQRINCVMILHIPERCGASRGQKARGFPAPGKRRNPMKLKTCEYCGTEFDSALSQCPLCGKAVQPGATQPLPVMSAPYKPAGRHGKKKGGRFAAQPGQKKKTPKENPYRLPKPLMAGICAVLALAVFSGAAFALYQLSWFPKFLSAGEQEVLQSQPEQEPAEEAQPEVAAQAPGEKDYMNEEDYTPDEEEDEQEAIIACEALTLATSSITFDEAERFYNITVQRSPEGCNEEVSFVSSDETIATVNQQGKVVAINGGTAIITATCGAQTATCLVTCDFIAEEEELGAEQTLPSALNTEDMTLFYPGEQAPLIVSNVPEGAAIAYTSENPSVATVSSSGTITAVGSGTTTVRAEFDGEKLECIVRCKLDASAETGADADAEGCTISHADVTMAFLGEYFKITLKDADGNRIKGLSWKSGNTGVCTVDADGVVTASGNGTTTVSTTYGGKSFECIIRCNLK